MRNLILSLLLGVVGMACKAYGGHVVEVYFVADQQVIQNYKTIGYSTTEAYRQLKIDHMYMVYQMNELFKSTQQYGLDIEIRSKRLDVLKSDIPGALVTGTNAVQNDQQLTTFESWLENNAPVTYDVAILWTGWDIWDSKTWKRNVLGYASVGRVCDGKDSAGIVEFRMDYMSARTAAHEVGHLLGSNHDGDKNAESCSDDGYIMSAITSITTPNSWTFSYCSAQQMNTLIATKSCLSRTTTPLSSFKMSDLGDDGILDVNQICTRSRVWEAKRSYACLDEAFYDWQQPQGDTVCQYIFCGPKGADSCRKTTPSEGIVCGLGKRCNKGKCITSPDHPTPSGIYANCLYGDGDAGVMNTYDATCPEYLDVKGNFSCTLEWVYKRCCHTCQKRKTTNIKGCEWGNKSKDCSKEHCSISAANREVCCETCA